MGFTYDAAMTKIAYTSGSTEFTEGETLTGATGGATGIVCSWDLTGGGWGAGTAAGDVYIQTLTGAFQAENLNGSTGGANMATASGASTAAYDNRNWARARCGDIDSSYPLFTDAEIDAIITKCTSGSTVDFDHVIGILFEVLGVDPIRVMESRKACSGGVGLLDEMDLYAKRSEVYTD